MGKARTAEDTKNNFQKWFWKKLVTKESDLSNLSGTSYAYTYAHVYKHICICGEVFIRPGFLNQVKIVQAKPHDVFLHCHVLVNVDEKFSLLSSSSEKTKDKGISLAWGNTLSIIFHLFTKFITNTFSGFWAKASLFYLICLPFLPQSRGKNKTIFTFFPKQIRFSFAGLVLPTPFSTCFHRWDDPAFSRATFPGLHGKYI